MRTNFIIIAVASALAVPAVATSNDAPYALRAVHADFQAQLERVAAAPGPISLSLRKARKDSARRPVKWLTSSLREGSTQHALTIRAAQHMTDLVDRAVHVRAVQP